MQVLVDTSVWIEFLSKREPTMKSLLLENRVVTHPFIIGEIACGSIKNRAQILSLLESLQQVQVSLHSEVLFMLKTHKLFGKGIGFIDLHLLSAALIAEIPLWTNDKRLHAISETHKIAYLNAKHLRAMKI